MNTLAEAELLLIDGDDSRRLSLFDQLTEEGFTVLQAAEVSDAAAILARTRPEGCFVSAPLLPALSTTLSGLEDPPPLYLLGQPAVDQEIRNLAGMIPDGRDDLLQALVQGLAHRSKKRSQRQDLERGLVELAALAIDLGRTARRIPDDDILRHALQRVLDMAKARALTAQQQISGLLFARLSHQPLSLRVAIGVNDKEAMAERYLPLVSMALAEDRVVEHTDGAVIVPLPTLQFQNGALVLLGIGRPGRESFVRLLRTAAAEISLARDANTLYHLAMIDGLTSVFNRSYGIDRLSKELRRASRTHRALTVAIIDLDHFKQINDRHGHVAGDYCLHHAAQALKRCTRATDILFRSGGEEFAAVLPGAGPRETELLGFKLCDALRRLEIEWKGMAIPMTASVGLASLPEKSLEDRYASGSGWSDLTHVLLQFADQAMYRAKEGGRDNFILAGRAGDVSSELEIDQILQAMG